MFEAVQNPPDGEFWTKVLNHKFLGKGPKWKQEELDGVLGDFQVSMLDLSVFQHFYIDELLPRPASTCQQPR